ncbi:hypothetical protein NL676_015463 [Syzygium grande]|nr:hypothetical protein NL676_015463 [Syzygium grande]
MLPRFGGAARRGPKTTPSRGPVVKTRRAIPPSHLMVQISAPSAATCPAPWAPLPVRSTRGPPVDGPIAATCADPSAAGPSRSVEQEPR